MSEAFIKNFEQTVEWFCDKVAEPVPLHPDDKEKIYKRMINLGWVRQSEIDTYKELTKTAED